MAISLQSFIDKTKGTYQNIPGATGTSLLGECVSLLQQYLDQCFGIGFMARGDAKDWINTLVKEGIAKKVTTPQKGDIVVYGKPHGQSGSIYYGHVGIYIDSKQMYDQFKTKVAGYSNLYATSGLLGYLRMNKALVSDFVGIPVTKDTIKNQIEVIATDLNVRSVATTKNNTPLGYANKGYYNYSSTTTADGYTWYQIEPNKWIAGLKSDTKIYPKAEDPKDKTISELETNIKELNILLKLKENNIFDLEEECKLLKAEIDLKNQPGPMDDYKKFIAPKDGYYYIRLFTGDKIYH